MPADPPCMASIPRPSGSTVGERMAELFPNSRPRDGLRRAVQLLEEAGRSRRKLKVTLVIETSDTGIVESVEVVSPTERYGW
jgi:hypothetical protein